MKLGLGRLRKRFKIKGESGQVSRRSGLGRWLYHLALEDDVDTIVEIGTWNGLGSTKLIDKALGLRKLPAKAYSLEANQEMFNYARRNANLSNVELVYGTLVTESDLDQDNLSATEKQWFHSDALALREAPLVSDRLPEVIDLLFLDGGEFSTYAEFEFLQHRVRRWLVLDDTHTRKCQAVEKELNGSSVFLKVAAGTDRNGWSVWMRLAGRE